MKVKAHALAPGFPYFADGNWNVFVNAEYEDGTTGVTTVSVETEEDVSALQKYFRSPTLEPIELVI